MFKKEMKDNILKIQTLISNQITFDYSYLEFIDGVYNIKQNKFYPLTTLNQNNVFSNVSTYKYYNKSYSRVRRNLPQN
jgi:hypothetical protein